MNTEVETSASLPFVDLYVIARSGSSTDPKGHEGALNLALRSLRRGTAKYPGTVIDAMIDRLGAEFSTLIDATSSAVHVTVLKRNLDAMVDLLAEIVTHPTFEDAAVAHVAREITADLTDALDDDRTLAGRHFRRTLFHAHPFGRPVAGTRTTLRALDRHAVVKAFSRTFTQANVTFAASGDITKSELDAIAARIGAGLSPTSVEAGEVPEPVGVKGRHLVIVDKPERSQTQIYIGALGTHPKDSDHAALTVGNTVFGGTFTSRLTREVRSKRGWSYGASSRLGRERVRDAFSMWTFPASKDAADCIALELKLLDTLVTKGVSAREASFVQSYLTRSAAFDVDTASKRLWRRLDEELLGLKPGWHDRHLKRLGSVTQAQINAALAKRLGTENLVISVVATASEVRAQLEAAIPDLASVRVVPFDTE